MARPTTEPLELSLADLEDLERALAHRAVRGPARKETGKGQPRDKFGRFKGKKKK
jgi:hypothetical protein